MKHMQYLIESLFSFRNQGASHIYIFINYVLVLKLNCILTKQIKRTIGL